MHPMVLGLAGYGLLLSSCVALAILLRIGCLRELTKSPLHILSTSDTLMSVFTSIILLVNQSLSPFNFVQELPMTGMSEVAYRQLLLHHEGNEYHQNRTCMKLDSQETDESISNCTFKHVLMHYAMFLVPFANAFVSLLVYSVQCSNGMSYVTKRCSKLMKTSKTFEIGDTEDPDSTSNTRKRNLDDQKDVNEICKDPEAGILDREKQEVSLTISDAGHSLGSLEKNRKFTGFGLTMQWLVPVLATAILYLSKTQDMNNMRESSEMDCIFKINFPLESCFKSGSFQSGDKMNHEKNYSGLAGYFEVEDSDNFRISHPDSKVIDEVVSRVRNLVNSVLNKICNNGTKLTDHRDFKPLNIAQYIIVNNLTQEMKSHGVEILEKLSNQSIGISRSDECMSINGNDSSNEDTKTFEELDLSQDIVGTSKLITTAGETVPSDSDLVKVTTDIDNVNDNKAENMTQKLNDEVQTEIINQIRHLVEQVEARKEPGNEQELIIDKFNSGLYDKTSINSGIEISSLRLKESRVLDNKKIIENVFPKSENDKQLQISDNKKQHCFLSANFLKIHLLILLFSVYFFPILISAVLQTRAVYICKNVFEKIESVNQKLSAAVTAKGEIGHSIRIGLNENPSKSGWFSTTSTENPSTPNNFQDIESPNIHLDSQEEEKSGYQSVLNETKSMQMLFSILKKTLLLGMLMWTPAFLEILTKVFLCTSTPGWLMNSLYLLGISFGIVKNYLNVSIAKIDKNMTDEIHKKENSVHPSRH